MNSVNLTIQKPEPVERERVDLSDLETFFAPHGVAVVGASPKPGNLGQHIVKSLKAHGYQGNICTVHPHSLQVENVPVVADISQLPAEVDLVIAAVSASRVLPLLGSLANNGIYHLIVIGGGFSETNEAGEILQNQLKEEAGRLGIRIVGPNGLGVFSAPDHFNSFFLLPGEIELPEPGPVAIISQSGAFMSQILDQLAKQGVGVHRAVNFGNRVDVGETELLEMFGNDPKVNVIGVYLESVQDGRKFFETAKSVAQRKPVIICKGGRGKQGIEAARAHSASLAGSYTVFQTAFEQAGLIEVQALEPLIDALHTLAYHPPIKGNRVLVVSNGGGMGVLLTDLCEQAGLKIPEASVSLQEHLRKFNPDYYSFRNPIDITGSGTNEQCLKIIDHLMPSGEFDSLLLVLLSGTKGIDHQLGTMLKGRRWSHQMPIVIGAHGKELFEGIQKNLRGQHIQVFPTGERAARALQMLIKAGRAPQPFMKEMPSRSERYKCLPTRNWFNKLESEPNEMQLKELLSQRNIPVPLHQHVPDRGQAEEAVRNIGFPLILKMAGTGITHKTELRGIRMGLKDPVTFMKVWEDMNRMWPGNIWAEQQIQEGLDLMVGAYRDHDFGPLILFGSGGRYVELYKDIARLLVPASHDEIMHLIGKTHAGKIIDGFRGEALAKNKLIDFLQWTASWILNDDSIQSLDFNPVRLFSDELIVLDAKIERRAADRKG